MFHLAGQLGSHLRRQHKLTFAEYRNRVGPEATGVKEGEDSPAEKEAGSSGHWLE